MNCTINGKDINVKCDFSFIHNRKSNKNHANEYIVESYIFTDKPLNEYEKEKIADFISNCIRRND